MPSSDVRQPQYVLNLMVEKVAESWATSAFAIGPSLVISKNDKGNFGFITVMANFRLKLGTSL